MSLTPGTRIGSFEITSLLGSGGMGQVYKAKDLKLGRDVAIKVLREELASDPERLRRFEQEARAASALNHPNIITIHDIGKHGPTPYIAMEFVDGVTLRQALSRGPLPSKDLLRFAVQIAEGLTKAHSAEIIHRDLKPENLMITSDGFVKILDFGLAKLRPTSTETGSEAATVTREGTVLGTVGYMSPEQAKGQSADHRSDQFSLGAILYEMATGKRAFERESPIQTLSAIIEREPQSMAELAPSVPAHFRVVVNRCLAKRPDDRYDSTRDLARDLASVDIAMPADSIVSRGITREQELVSVEGKDKASISRHGGGLKIHVEEGGERVDLEIPARHVYIPVVVILVVAIALLLGLNVCGLRDRILGGASPPRIESLAVLPLENLSGDPEQEYFVDGMTEALIAELGTLKALRVISRTSVMMYKGARKPLRDIAQELDVEAVVEGSVVRSGDRVRITTQLVQAVPEKHLWAESYERELGDVLQLQSEIAQSIAREIRITVSPVEQQRMASAPQVVPEAYEAYLRGRHFQDERTFEGLRRSMEYFRKTADIDPTYAAAWAGVADSFNLQIFWGFAQPKEVFPQYRAAVMKALELDADLAEVHATLADLKWFENWDWNGAEIEFKRAIELNPSYANAHSWYANLLTERGRAEEAIERRKQAQRLDPLSPILNVAVVGDMYMAGRYEEALAELDQTLELSPGFPLAHYLIGLCREQLSKTNEAIEALEKARDGFEGSSLALGALGHAYAASGNRRRALEIIEELTLLSEAEHVPAFDLAIVYAGLGDSQKALEWLERAYEDRIGWIVYIKVDPRLEHLHSEPRFQELLRRMNLAD